MMLRVWTTSALGIGIVWIVAATNFVGTNKFLSSLDSPASSSADFLQPPPPPPPRSLSTSSSADRNKNNEEEEGSAGGGEEEEKESGRGNEEEGGAGRGGEESGRGNSIHENNNNNGRVSQQQINLLRRQRQQQQQQQQQQFNKVVQQQQQQQRRQQQQQYNKVRRQQQQFNKVMQQWHRDNNVQQYKENDASFGMVISDIREDGTVHSSVLPWIKQAHRSAPRLPCEVWIGAKAKPDKELDDYIAQHNTTWLNIRRVPPTPDDVPAGLDLNSLMGSHIAKAYALKESAFEFPIFFDTDVAMCSGWLDRLKNDILNKQGVYRPLDVVWTYAPNPFGATLGINDLYVSKADIDPVVEEYKQFIERNSGTLFAVRKTNATQAWLQTVMELFQKQNEAYPPGTKKNGYTDQLAFREGMFLHRHSVNEYAFTGKSSYKLARKEKVNHKWACRNLKTCKCGKPCLLMHSKTCGLNNNE